MKDKRGIYLSQFQKWEIRSWCQWAFLLRDLIMEGGKARAQEPKSPPVYPMAFFVCACVWGWSLCELNVSHEISPSNTVGFGINFPRDKLHTTARLCSRVHQQTLKWCCLQIFSTLHFRKSMIHCIHQYIIACWAFIPVSIIRKLYHTPFVCVGLFIFFFYKCLCIGKLAEESPTYCCSPKWWQQFG